MANQVQTATDKAGVLSQDPNEIETDVSGVTGVVASAPLGISKGANTEPGGAGAASSETKPIMGVAGAYIETDGTFVSDEDSVGTESRLHPHSFQNEDYRNEAPPR